ncbi:hypothetical protein D3C81_845280 [compost metagenome]
MHRVDTDGRLERLIVFRERPFVHLVEGEETRHPFGVHDERVHSGFRRCIGFVVGHVGAGPHLAVPPHQPFVRVPRFALGVTRGAVVENPSVHRPGPGPAQVLLHAERIAVVTPGHQVALLGPAAAEDPATGRRAAIVLELGEAGQLLTGLDHRARGVGDIGDGVAVEFPGQLFRRGIIRYFVGPVELEDRLGPGTAVGLITLAQAQEQLAHDLHVSARLPRAVGTFPVPLQPAAAVDQ